MFIPLRFFQYTCSSRLVRFILRRISYPLCVNQYSNLDQYSPSLTFQKLVPTDFSIIYFCLGSILSCKYFLITLVPPVLTFCLIVFSGLPSSWILTKELINPIQHGRSGKSLLDKSKVFNFFNLIISFEIFLILLSLNTNTVKFGQRSKYVNSVNRLKDKEIVSNFYEFGNQFTCSSLFYFSYSMIRLLEFVKELCSICWMEFLLRFRISRPVHFWKFQRVIYRIQFYWSSAFFMFQPRFGILFNLLLLRKITQSVLSLSRLGQYSNKFSDKLISTIALALAICSGTTTTLFRLKSTDFSKSNLHKLAGISLTALFLILNTCRSAILIISSGMVTIQLFDTSIFDIGLHYHQF